jgi:hypothetical protein
MRSAMSPCLARTIAWRRVQARVLRRSRAISCKRSKESRSSTYICKYPDRSVPESPPLVIRSTERSGAQTSFLFRMCEPTTHRLVRRIILPPPHHPHECRPEPTLSAPAGVGSSLHCPSGASPGSGDRGRWWGSTARVSPPIHAVSRVATSSASRTQPAEQRERTSAGTSRTAVASATNRSDALSVRGDKSAVMRCRKKVSDALSVRTYETSRRRIKLTGRINRLICPVAHTGDGNYYNKYILTYK